MSLIQGKTVPRQGLSGSTLCAQHATCSPIKCSIKEHALLLTVPASRNHSTHEPVSAQHSAGERGQRVHPSSHSGSTCAFMQYLVVSRTLAFMMITSHLTSKNQENETKLW